MCEYCKNIFTDGINEDIINADFPTGTGRAGVAHTYIKGIDNDAYLVTRIDGGSNRYRFGSIKAINYCPICGRKLTRDPA